VGEETDNREAQGMLSEEELSRAAHVAESAAREAGAVISAAFGVTVVAKFKASSADLVTETDEKAEAIVMRALRSAFPGHDFVGEEGTAAAGGIEAVVLGEGPTWMVDPLDGTTNFVHGFPFVCVSIGLVVGRQPVLGVIYNPVLEEMFVAIKGRGATLNGSKIRTSGCESLSLAVVGTEVGVGRSDAFMDATFRRLRSLTQSCRSIRCSGSCAMNLAGVALGRLDAFYEIDFGGPWDCAAGAILVLEAGGHVVDPSGGAFDVMSRKVLAGNPGVVKEMVPHLHISEG